MERPVPSNLLQPSAEHLPPPQPRGKILDVQLRTRPVEFDNRHDSPAVTTAESSAFHYDSAKMALEGMYQDLPQAEVTLDVLRALPSSQQQSFQKVDAATHGYVLRADHRPSEPPPITIKYGFETAYASDGVTPDHLNDLVADYPPHQFADAVKRAFFKSRAGTKVSRGTRNIVKNQIRKGRELPPGAINVPLSTDKPRDAYAVLDHTTGAITLVTVDRANGKHPLDAHQSAAVDEAVRHMADPRQATVIKGRITNATLAGGLETSTITPAAHKHLSKLGKEYPLLHEGDSAIRSLTVPIFSADLGVKTPKGASEIIDAMQEQGMIVMISRPPVHF